MTEERMKRLKLDMPFEEAMKKAVQVKPPVDGFGEKKIKSPCRTRKAKRKAG